jgi:hypothetical protein
MERGLEGLSRMARVEPPPELDALVRGRLRTAVLERRAAAQGVATMGAPASRAAANVPLVERCVYAVGLLAYGTQAVSILERVVWRTFAG